MAWIQNKYYVIINLCSTYVNEMLINICHKISVMKKYLSQNLLKCYFIGQYNCHVQFYFIEYNYMSNASQVKND